MIEQDFDKHANVLIMLTEAQEVESDQRDLVEEQKIFLLESDGQWDERTISLYDDQSRYRGTFDQVSPIIDQITGEMDDAEFSIKVSPTGGDSTEDTADTLSGLIRNIENISNANQIYSTVGISVVMGGYDGFEIVQEFLDANTFDQDLIMKPVSDFYKSVWFDLAAIKQDKSDANWAIKLREMPAANYDKQFPDGSGVSIGDNHTNRASDYTEYDSVTVGRLYYKKEVNIEIVRMTSGAIYEVNDDFEKIKDELAQAGEVVEDERVRRSWRVYSRLLDGSDWLTDAKETVFDDIPLIPAYGNYAILDKKNIYFGKTLKMMDAQRGFNFAQSAETEEIALSPNDATWMTKEQGAGEDYDKMNIDRHAVRFYNAQPDQPPPFKMGGKMGNPGLQASAATFQSLISSIGNIDDPAMGQNPGLQSGAAISQLVSQSNNGNVKWFKSMEVCICHAYKVLLKAIPRVYDGTRQQRILAEDGTGKNVTLNTTVFDQQSGQNVSVNDLSKGSYDVTCSMGVSFKNQQEATTQALIQYASIDPAMMEMGRDILLKNQTSPGMDLLAERFRQLMIANGSIPESQWTEEEAAKIQQQQQEAQGQEQPEDPNMVIAQAELLKGQADMANAQNKQAQLQIDQIKVQQGQQQIDLDTAKAQFDAGNKDGSQSIDAAKAQAEIDSKNAKTQRDLAEAEQTRVETESLKNGVTDLMNRIQTGNINGN